MHRVARSAIPALLFAFCLQPATAAIVTYQFTGEVSGVAPELVGAFETGELLEGTLNVDTENTTPQGFRTIYRASDLLVTIGGDYAVTGNAGSLIITDNLSFSSGDSLDSFTVSFSNSSGPNVSGPPANGLLPGYFDIQLDWLNGQDPFDSQELLSSVPLNFDHLDRSNINFPSDGERLSYRLTSMSLVPIPSAALLFGTALGLLGWLKRKSK